MIEHPSSSSTIHVPVMLQEILQWLDPQAGELLVDGTLGGGGHTRALAEKVQPGGRILSLDRDPAALVRAEQALLGLPVRMVVANYCQLPEILEQLQLGAVKGILLDLGLSSDQLADRERGFSFSGEGILDLRFNPEEGEPAWQLLQYAREEEIARIIFEYGEERHSRRIARRIVEERRRGPIKSSAQFAELVRRCVPPSADTRRIHPATRTFQALRIAVNEELKFLEKALAILPECLIPGGRLAIISFHSLEDRLVKHAFRAHQQLEVLTKKPILPSAVEVSQNPRSRSAKLRVATRQIA